MRVLKSIVNRIKKFNQESNNPHKTSWLEYRNQWLSENNTWACKELEKKLNKTHYENN